MLSLIAFPTAMDPRHALAAFGAAFLAGTINSVAGGGTLLTFPTLIWLGLPPINANATSTVAIWPGTVGTIWGYRQDLSTARPRMFALVAPSVIGGILGALLLNRTPPAVFDALVPFLILFATLLFMIQEPVQRRLKISHPETHKSTRWLIGALTFQLFVALYGGYFGAGIGILMLAALSVLGLTDIHQMNGLKALLGASVNGVAALYFISAHMVYWPEFVVMVTGAIIGGYGGARIARRIGGKAVRRIVILVGLSMAVAMFVRFFRG
ncbi:MAG TPA: sulfite exporter TauE/SafE family protein [Bryobacteraceae bacterium]|nr:sulfite exporter TauE/SafE family protein [Bryobacteraceae bacterium]